MCIRDRNEIFRGYNFTGVEFSIFPIDFEWALQQCSATALPVIESRMSFRLVPTSETLNDLEMALNLRYCYGIL